MSKIPRVLGHFAVFPLAIIFVTILLLYMSGITYCIMSNAGQLANLLRFHSHYNDQFFVHKGKIWSRGCVFYLL